MLNSAKLEYFALPEQANRSPHTSNRRPKIQKFRDLRGNQHHSLQCCWRHEKPFRAPICLSQAQRCSGWSCNSSAASIPPGPLVRAQHSNYDENYKVRECKNVFHTMGSCFPKPDDSAFAFSRETVANSGYTDSKISLEWLKRVFDPKLERRLTRSQGC
jgi:hypothetical protein